MALHPGMSYLKEQQTSYAKIEDNLAFWRSALSKVATAFEAKEFFCVSNENIYMKFKLDNKIGIDFSESDSQIQQTIHFTQMSIYSLRFFCWLLNVH